MGARQSSIDHQKGDRQVNTVIKNPHINRETSTGFHMIKFHVPSATFSMFTVLFLVLVMAAIFFAYRRYVRKQEQRRILTAVYRRNDNRVVFPYTPSRMGGDYPFRQDMREPYLQSASRSQRSVFNDQRPPLCNTSTREDESDSRIKEVV